MAVSRACKECDQTRKKDRGRQNRVACSAELQPTNYTVPHQRCILCSQRPAHTSTLYTHDISAVLRCSHSRLRTCLFFVCLLKLSHNGTQEASRGTRICSPIPTRLWTTCTAIETLLATDWQHFSTVTQTLVRHFASSFCCFVMGTESGLELVLLFA
jgi:hypothetical protein